MPRQNQVGQILSQAYGQAAQMRARAGQIEGQGMRALGQGIAGAANTVGDAISEGKEISDKAGAIRKAIKADKSGTLSELTGITEENMPDLSDRQVLQGLEAVKLANEVGAVQLNNLRRQKAAAELAEMERYQGRATRLNRSIDEARSMVEQADQGAQIFREDRLREAQQLLQTPAARMRTMGGAVTAEMLRENPQELLTPQPQRLTPGQRLDVGQGLVGVATNEDNITVMRDPTLPRPTQPNPYTETGPRVVERNGQQFYQGAPGDPYRPVPRQDEPRSRAEILESMPFNDRDTYDFARRRVAEINRELTNPRRGLFGGTNVEKLREEKRQLQDQIRRIETDYGLRGSGSGNAPPPAPPPEDPPPANPPAGNGEESGTEDRTYKDINLN